MALVILGPWPSGLPSLVLMLEVPVLPDSLPGIDLLVVELLTEFLEGIPEGWDDCCA